MTLIHAFLLAGALACLCLAAAIAGSALMLNRLLRAREREEPDHTEESMQRAYRELRDRVRRGA
jgi:hypothetical protein